MRIFVLLSLVACGGSSTVCLSAHECDAVGSVCVGGDRIEICEVADDGCRRAKSLPCSEGCVIGGDVCTGCGDSVCSLGMSECTAGRIQFCEPDARGCVVLGEPQECSTGVCADDAHCESCDECAVAGQSRCVGDAVETCTSDDKGCLRWETSECVFGCENDACIACAASGFSASETPWPLPDPGINLSGSNKPFERTLQHDWLCDGSSRRYTYELTDLNGDELPDIVILRSCVDTQVGESYWDVYLNTGTGFSTTRTMWMLPDPGYGLANGNGTFSRTNKNSWQCAGPGPAGSFSYTLTDINGDKLPDVVITESCTDVQTGEQQWDVYLNTGSGFSSTETTWPLPQLGHQLTTTRNSFARTAVVGWDCQGSGGDFTYSLLDINGDGKKDIVVLESCTDNQTGSAHWDIYLNTGSGFSTSKTTLGLPDPGYGLANGYKLFERVVNSSWRCDMGTSRFSYELTDINGDNLPDIVIMESCADQLTGEQYWDVYLNSASGFSAVASRWLLPDPGYQISGSNTFLRSTETLWDCAGSTESFTYALRDINGDAMADIVIMQSCNDSMTGESHWDVYFNDGNGFSQTKTAWRLPDPGYQLDNRGRTFTRLTQSSWGCATDLSKKFSYQLVDVNGDRLLDVVITEACDDPTTGAVQWDTYLSFCP